MFFIGTRVFLTVLFFVIFLWQTYVSLDKFFEARVANTIETEYR